MRLFRCIVVGWAMIGPATILGAPDGIGGPNPSMVEPYLLSGQLERAEHDLSTHLTLHDQDDQARFGLAVAQFLGGVQRLAQSLHKHGLRSGMGQAMGIPILRLPVEPNEDPKRISYDDFRAMLQAWVDDLVGAEATLSKITAKDVCLPLPFGRVRLDLDGDGVAAEHETLWRLYDHLNGGIARHQDGQAMAQQAQAFMIAFDRGDVHWLRGYCHLLAALGEVVLAHDGREIFERTAHLFFPNVHSPFEFLVGGQNVFAMGDTDIADVIALIHLIRLPVIEPQRMTKALQHLRFVADQSIESWRHIVAEKDDYHEWIPGPEQSGVIPNVAVTQAMIDGWHEFLKEFESLLAGETLIPFWRGDGTKGVNLRRVFVQPATFDLVLWIQGTGAAPYLEKGRLTDRDLWRRLGEIFGGQFIGFAIWFN